MDGSTLVAFVLASLVLVVVPGPNLIYILARSANEGRRAGVASALGVECGTVVHLAVAALGVSSLVAASPVLLPAVQYAGAAYLVHLGVRTLRRPAPTTAVTLRQPVPLRRAFLDGLLVNVLNPKVVVFFVAFVPQFISPDAGPGQARTELLVLGAVLLTIGLATDVCYAVAGAAARRVLRGNRLRYPAAAVYLGLAGLAAAPVSVA